MSDGSDVSMGGEAVGTAVSVGTAAAQGFANPVSDIMAVTSLIGLGTSLFGSTKAAANSKEIADLSGQIEGYNADINSQRQTQMNLEANRQQLQNIRNSQLARSMATSSATNQGAQFGSGLGGGYGQISGQVNTNTLGVNQNRQIANSIFGYNADIDSLKTQIASLEGASAADKGISAIGNSLMQASGPLGRLLGNGTGTSTSNYGSNLTSTDMSNYAALGSFNPT